MRTEVTWGVEGGHAAEVLSFMQGPLRDCTSDFSSWASGLSAVAVCCETRVCVGVYGTVLGTAINYVGTPGAVESGWRVSPP